MRSIKIASPFIIFLFFIFSNTFSQGTLFIELAEKGNQIEIKAITDSGKHSFIVYDSEKVFSSCNKLDKIVSKTNYGRPRVIKKLNKEIDYLSEILIAPIESQVENCDLINIKITLSSVRIPFEFLRLNGRFIYKQKPILFSYEKTSLDQIEKLDLQKGFIVCDLTADPENACGAIHEKKTSDFHYITDINLDTIKNARDMDFILMSVHGGIYLDSCKSIIVVNDEILYPSAFTQKNLKLIYFDSCHLGKGKNFVDQFHTLNAEYYIGPIISNEAGNSSTKTILTFFKHLDNNNPLESLMKTKKELMAYSDDNILVELWFAAPFRLYKMN